MTWLTGGLRKERDALNNQRLESLSWSIITIWECELKSKAFEATIARVISELHQNKSKWEAYQAKRRSDREFARSEAHRKRQIRAEVERECRSSSIFRSRSGKQFPILNEWISYKFSSGLLEWIRKQFRI